MIWLALIAAAALFGYLLYRMRQKKKNQQRVSYYVTTPSLWVSIPSDIPQDQGEKIARDLDDSLRKVWHILHNIYGVEPRSKYVSTVHVVHGPAHDNHPNVVWSIGGNIIRLSLAGNMLKWWMLELHNVFRYGLYGGDWIYNTIDDNDAQKAKEAQRWIIEHAQEGT